MRRTVQICAFLSVVIVVGCRLFPSDADMQSRSPLQPPYPSPDSVTIEVMWARFPPDDRQLNEEAWREIDETRIAPAVRRELVNNGFRVGVVSSVLPEAISRILCQSNSQAKDTTAADTAPTIDLLVEPKVWGRVLQLRRDRRSEIQASSILAEVPLLLNEGRELHGHTYHDAQAVYALKVDPQPDRTVQVELTPELHYGPPGIDWTGGEDGILRPTSLRDRKVFDQLQVNLELAPGEILVAMNLPNSSSRLGHFFHTVDTDGGRQQKVVLIRLAQVPCSDTFEKPQ